MTTGVSTANAAAQPASAGNGRAVSNQLGRRYTISAPPPVPSSASEIARKPKW